MEIATIISMTVAVAAVVARFLPPPKATTGVYAIAYTVVNVLAQNGGQAANANAPVKQ